MEKRERVNAGQKCGRTEEACKRYGLGVNSLRKLADEAGAVVRVGRAYLINFDILDQYIDNLSGKFTAYGKEEEHD